MKACASRGPQSSLWGRLFRTLRTSHEAQNKVASPCFTLVKPRLYKPEMLSCLDKLLSNQSTQDVGAGRLADNGGNSLPHQVGWTSIRSVRSYLRTVAYWKFALCHVAMFSFWSYPPLNILIILSFSFLLSFQSFDHQIATVQQRNKTAPATLPPAGIITWSLDGTWSEAPLYMYTVWQIQNYYECIEDSENIPK